MKNRSMILLLMLLFASLSCQKTDMVEDSLPISFSSEQTKAQGISTVHDNFRVWSAKINGGVSSGVMDGYRVNYSGQGWTYVDGDGTSSQHLCFWDKNADSYRFHGGAPCDAVSSITADGLILSLSATTQLNETAVYSSPVVVSNKSEFGNTVVLPFNQASCRIHLQFKMKTAQSVDKVLSQIALIPTSPDKYVKIASMTLTHSWNDQTTSKSVSANQYSESGARLEFGSVTLNAPGTTYQTTSTEYWYMIPTTSSSSWTISFYVGSQLKTKTFQSGYAWESGKSYLYTFEVSDDVVMLSDITVEGWTDETINVEIGGNA